MPPIDEITGEVNFQMLSEATSSDDETFREAAFKRGFHHGVITLLEAAAQYLPPEVLTNLQKYEAEVRQWRYTRRQVSRLSQEIFLESCCQAGLV